MESLMLNVRVDAKDKKVFEKFCNDVGMNISTAINLFIKNVIREQKLPFEIKTSSYEKDIIEKLLEAEKEMQTSNVRYSWEEVMKELRETKE